MHGLLSLYVLSTVATFADAAAPAAHGDALRSMSRLAPSASAVVYASQGEIKRMSSKPPDHVEMLRFVTAYRTGIEAMIDMTPYTPLLQASVAADNLTLYTFIDSWVNNHTEKDILYMNNVTGMCTLKNMSDGNGWGLTASLLFWPPQAVSTQPKASVTLSPGGNDGYPIGRVGFHSANVSEDGRALLLEKAVDFSMVQTAAVYDLAQHELGLAGLMGFVAKQTEVFTRQGNAEALEYMLQDAFETLLWQGLGSVHVSRTDDETHTLWGKYNGSELQWEVDMPVYYASSDIFTDQNVGNGWWMNATMPLKPVGEVMAADGENITIHLKHQCLPSNWTKGLPRLLIPANKHVLPKIKGILDSAKKIGLESAKGESANGQSATGSAKGLADDFPVFLVEGGSRNDKGLRGAGANGTAKDHQPMFLRPNGTAHANDTYLVSPTVLGSIDLVAAGNGTSAGEDTWQRLLLEHPISSAHNFTDGSKVMVLTQERHGLILQRDFDMPNLTFGDRVIVQLAVTGHGWASTAEQCGEYCHAVYRMHLNGRSAANVTQFRNDCKDNPINGSVQYGTWDESRNGWCPGTVVPGLFIDMTDHLKKGSNHLAVDLLVWSNRTLSYEPYTDYAGFVFNDHAVLHVGLNAFVYGESAVQAIRNQDRAFTAAEAALRDGSSAPERLRPPAFVREGSEGQVLLQIGSRAATSNYMKVSEHPASQSALFRRDTRSFLEGPDTFMGKPIHQSMVPVFPDYRPPSSVVERRVRKLARAEVQGEGYGSNSKTIYLHNQMRVNSNVNNLTRFDFEERAPWYLYNETAEGGIEVTRVPIFTNKLMQGSSRDVHVHIDKSSIPSEFGQVALHFQLHKPPGNLSYDHWDRVGSMGLRFMSK